MEMLPSSTWPLSGARCGVCVWGLGYVGTGGGSCTDLTCYGKLIVIN